MTSARASSEWQKGDGRLTDILAARVGLRKAPGRYLGPGRSWIAESRFRPLVDLRDAVRVLEEVTNDYSLSAAPGGLFTAEVRIGSRTARRSGESKARTIALAVADALGIEVAK